LSGVRESMNWEASAALGLVAGILYAMAVQ
jgi:hypothetical protein